MERLGGLRLGQPGVDHRGSGGVSFVRAAVNFGAAMTLPIDTPEGKAAVAELAEVISWFVPADAIDHWTLRYLGDPAGLNALLDEIHAELAARPILAPASSPMSSAK